MQTENIPPTKWQKNGALPADDKERETCYTGIVPNWDKRKGRTSVTVERCVRGKHFPTGCGQPTGLWWPWGCGLLLSVRPVLAETIWDRFSSIMQDIYGQVVAISTIVAVTVAAIALIVRMVSRNQRAVDEATSWLKRIVVTWIVLNTLGFIVAYLQPLIAGGQYTGRRKGGEECSTGFLRALSPGFPASPRS